jgi:hypothetical protein
MLWEVHRPSSDGVGDADGAGDADDADGAVVVTGVLAAVLVFARVDGLVGSSELLVCWKPQAAKADAAANAARRQTTFFIAGLVAVPVTISASRSQI